MLTVRFTVQQPRVVLRLATKSRRVLVSRVRQLTLAFRSLYSYTRATKTKRINANTMAEDSSLDSIPGSSSSSKDLPFQRWSQWLGSISEHDAELLQLQPEYEEFLTVMRRLEQTHITMLNSVGTSPTTTGAVWMTCPPVFLLQHSLLLRIYDFLECRDLVHSSVVCRRMYRLSHETARIRSRHTTARTLPTDLQQVRLHEQWHGRACTREYAVVPRPFLLLPKRVLVTQCGDPDLNGVYLCTAACGNGFCFTQPLRCTSATAQKRCRMAKRFSGTVRVVLVSCSCQCGSIKK